MLVLTEPGKITRIDYRKFTWSAYVNFQTTRKQLAGMENVWDRIKKYLEHRDRKSYNVTLEEETRTIVLEFEKLDDARMFMLAFSDAIIDNGIKYE